MPTPTLWTRSLGYRETQVLCLLAVAVHLLPLILADHFYIDDSWRSQEAGTAWVGEGRPLTQALYAALSFSTAAPNLFPLPLLLAASATALALARLVWHYFEAPTASCVLVVLPLWYNPLFLQNLSYQYDGAAMALALAACLMAIVMSVQRWQAVMIGALWVAVACSFYQISLNVFTALCCVEIVREAASGRRLGEVIRHGAGRLGQLLTGCLLYYLTAYQWMGPSRTALVPFDGQWLPSLWQRMGQILDWITLFWTPGTSWFVALLALCAAIGWLLAVWTVMYRREPLWQKALLVVALVVPLLAIVPLVPGITLLFDTFNDGARTLMAFGVLMLAVAWLAHRGLTRLDARLGWALAIPLLAMLSFAFAHGRVMVLQKELQQAATFMLAHDVTATPQLVGITRYHVLDVASTGQYLPAAEGSYTVMPALRYVLNINFLLLPEMMPRLGLSQFEGAGVLNRAQVLQRSPAALVDNRFYAIHRIGDTGYVLMKRLCDPDPGP